MTGESPRFNGRGGPRTSLTLLGKEELVGVEGSTLRCWLPGEALLLRRDEAVESRKLREEFAAGEWTLAEDIEEALL